MVSQWRYRCACYRTARHASAPAAHATQSISASLAVYLPAAQSRHVADEPVAFEYVPARQEVHVDAPAHTNPGRVWCVRLSMRHTRHAGRHEERQQ